jgi:hypothetical protein
LTPNHSGYIFSIMKRSSKTNDTPEIQPVQVKVALLLAGETFRTLSRKWGVDHVTLWRAAHNLNCTRGTAARLRPRLRTFISQYINKKVAA